MFSGPLLFLAAQYYADHPEQCVLLLPDDFSPVAQPGRDPYLHQRLELNLSQFHPFQIWTTDDLRRHALESALIDPTEADLTAVHRDGLRPQTRFATPLHVVYLQ